MLRSEAAVGGVIRLSTVTEPDVARQVAFTHAAKHAQIRLEQRKETRSPILMYFPTCVFLLRMMHEFMYVAFHRPIAAGRVGVEPTTRLPRQVGGLLDRLDREYPSVCCTANGGGQVTFTGWSSYFLCLRHGFRALGSRCAITGHFLHALPLR
jgi:hypothetical protein